jgi:hypothetical protein
MALLLAGVLALGLSGGLAEERGGQAALGDEVRVVREQRGLFNTVRVKRDLRAVCDGQEPLNVEVRHTAGDALSAIFTGILYTPAHLYVTCPTPSTRP